MEDYSNFIHEEVFIIDEGETSSSSVMHPVTPQPNYEDATAEQIEEMSVPTNSDPDLQFKVGILAPVSSEEEKELLFKILGAVSIKPDEACVTSQISKKIGTWIVFQDSLDSLSGFSGPLEHFTINKHGESTIITSKSIGHLKNSVVDKGRLWGLLKEHFKV